MRVSSTFLALSSLLMTKIASTSASFSSTCDFIQEFYAPGSPNFNNWDCKCTQNGSSASIRCVQPRVQGKYGVLTYAYKNGIPTSASDCSCSTPNCVPGDKCFRVTYARAEGERAKCSVISKNQAGQAPTVLCPESVCDVCDYYTGPGYFTVNTDSCPAGARTIDNRNNGNKAPCQYTYVLPVPGSTPNFATQYEISCDYLRNHYGEAFGDGAACQCQPMDSLLTPGVTCSLPDEQGYTFINLFYGFSRTTWEPTDVLTCYCTGEAFTGYTCPTKSDEFCARFAFGDKPRCQIQLPTGVACPSYSHKGTCTIGNTYSQGLYFRMTIQQNQCPGSSVAMPSNPLSTLVMYPDPDFPVGGNYPQLP